MKIILSLLSHYTRSMGLFKMIMWKYFPTESHMNYKYFMFVFNIHCFAHFTFLAVQHNYFLALCTTNCFTCFVYVGMIIVICYSHASFWLDTIHIHRIELSHFGFGILKICMKKGPQTAWWLHNNSTYLVMKYFKFCLRRN